MSSCAFGKIVSVWCCASRWVQILMPSCASIRKSVPHRRHNNHVRDEGSSLSEGYKTTTEGETCQPEATLATARQKRMLGHVLHEGSMDNKDAIVVMYIKCTHHIPSHQCNFLGVKPLLSCKHPEVTIHQIMINSNGCVAQMCHCCVVNDCVDTTALRDLGLGRYTDTETLNLSLTSELAVRNQTL
jgi:hypothetical protein